MRCQRSFFGLVDELFRFNVNSLFQRDVERIRAEVAGQKVRAGFFGVVHDAADFKSLSHQFRAKECAVIFNHFLIGLYYSTLPGLRGLLISIIHCLLERLARHDPDCLSMA